MSRAFSDITFTPSVKAAQSRYGTRRFNLGFETVADRQDELTEFEVEFIQRRDGFFQASVGETGWPYVQFRGGAPGFLRVIDSRTIAFADFRGNVQYISVGNINADDRVALILMDQADPRRLKIWGRARVIDRADDPELVGKLQVPGYSAKVERAIVISIEAYDWNCPQHITPRFTEAEIREKTAPLMEELTSLRARLEGASPIGRPMEIGSGDLRLMIAGVRILSPRVRAYALKAADGSSLPVFDPGAHVSIPVRLPDGTQDRRHYSIASDPDDPRLWEIAVQREDNGLGGSLFVHSHYHVGDIVNCVSPRNGFELHTDARPAVLLAGGIGVAPLRCMALALLRDERPFALHYAARSSAEAPYLAELLREMPQQLHTYWSDHGPSGRMDMPGIVSAAPSGAVFYVCGPERMLNAFLELSLKAGLADERVRLERFIAPTSSSTDRPFEVQLGRGGKVLGVPVGTSILDVMLASGMHPPYDCKVGTCGTCAVKVLEGEPDHRDVVLSRSERERDKLMCTCVSRSTGKRLVLDMDSLD
jgi:ferredoxin-NADP reductase/predicted pyridoxine 5'-phosphate oxidase superfamily flavin-nucleotide-binding protein